MVVTIQQVIGKINPSKYAENGKELLQKYGSIEKIPAKEVKPKSLSEHKIVYDSMTDIIERIYFFIVDLMDDFGLKPEKLVDNFVSTPGSAHHGEFGIKATQMQQQATKIMGDINTVLKSIINIIHDLRDFKTRLSSYDDLKSKEKEKQEAARLSLKQIWLDKVDVLKGNSGIKAMTFGQAGFNTLLDAFLVAKDEKDAKNLDLNEIIKRIVISRIHEFNTWLKESEAELRKRYEIEKNYLKSQVNSLRLYSKWVKPYLKAAEKLQMREYSREPALVKTFNTIILEFSLWGKNKVKIKDLAASGDFPKELSKMKHQRDFYKCVLIDLNFRGMPQKQTGYTFAGKTEIIFQSYALNDDELKLMNEEIDKAEREDMIDLIEGATTESLDQLKDEINYYLEEPEKPKEEKKKNVDSSNPFKALIGGYEKKAPEKKEKEKPKKISVRKETFIEKEFIIPYTEDAAKELAFTLYDIYKKANGMNSFT